MVFAKSNDGIYNTIVYFIKSKEQLRLKPYTIKSGKPLIGWGHQMTNKEYELYKNGISLNTANMLFDKDYQKSIKLTNTYFPNIKSYKNKLVIAAIGYNLGFKFANKGLGYALKNNKDISPYLLQYVNINKVANKHLIQRRKEELILYISSEQDVVKLSNKYLNKIKQQ
jgi:GH24 family phage-related lysozyme (muramidase)